MFELIIEREGRVSEIEFNRSLPEPEFLPPERTLKEAS
jgi:hypothetical protein